MLRMLPMAFVLLAVCALLPAQTIPAETDFQVKLLTPVNSQSNKAGDALNAQVVSPAAFAGDIMEGKIQASKKGSKIKGQSVLSFSFDRLNHAGAVIPVQASVKEVVNSQGKRNVDEEGRIITRKNSIGKAALGAGVGALIGAVAGGAKGAAIGAGAGAVAALVLIELGSTGPVVSFAPGSQFILSVKERR